VLGVSAVGEDGRIGHLEVPFAVDRTLSALSLTTPLLTPNGDGTDDSLGVGFTLSAASVVTVQIEQSGTVVASVFSGQLPAGPSELFWDGSTPGGPAASGSYDAAVIVSGPFGITRHAAAFTISR
jgi:hypothetical protein